MAIKKKKVTHSGIIVHINFQGSKAKFWVIRVDTCSGGGCDIHHKFLNNKWQGRRTGTWSERILGLHLQGRKNKSRGRILKLTSIREGSNNLWGIGDEYFLEEVNSDQDIWTRSKDDIYKK